MLDPTEVNEMSTPTYDQVLGAARTGSRAVVDHLPLEALGDQLERVQGLDWDDLPFSDLAIDEAIGEVIADVNNVVRRHPRAVAAIVVASVSATFLALWFLRRRRQRRGEAEQTELRLAGVA